MDALDRKLTRVFAGKVVRKDLLHQLKGGENVPSYVLEYLLGRYCASEDEEEIRLGIEAVKDTLRKNYFRHDEANKAQSLVEQSGKHRFIDRVEVRFLPSETKYWASMENFGFSRIHVPQEYYRRYERLLEGASGRLSTSSALQTRTERRAVRFASPTSGLCNSHASISKITQKAAHSSPPRNGWTSYCAASVWNRPRLHAG